VADIARRTGAHEFHGSARGVHPSQMRYRNPALQDLSPHTDQTNADEVRAMKKQLLALR
jgi:copper homeostasis protein